MKNLITTIGSILILSIFILQFVANEKLLIYGITVESLAKTYVEDRDSGKFVSSLKRELGLDSSELNLKEKEDSYEVEVSLNLPSVYVPKVTYVSKGKFK